MKTYTYTNILELTLNIVQTDTSDGTLAFHYEIPYPNPEGTSMVDVFSDEKIEVDNTELQVEPGSSDAFVATFVAPNGYKITGTVPDNTKWKLPEGGWGTTIKYDNVHDAYGEKFVVSVRDENAKTGDGTRADPTFTIKRPKT